MITIKQFRKEVKHQTRRSIKESLIDLLVFIGAFIISELIGHFNEENKTLLIIRFIILLTSLFIISYRIKQHLKQNYYKCPECFKGIIGADNQHLVELTKKCYHCEKQIIKDKD